MSLASILSGAGPQGVSAITSSVARAAPKADWRVLLSGLSSLLPVIQQSRANRDAQDDLLRGTAELEATQGRADTLIGDELAALSSSNPQQEKARALGDYAGAVQRSRQAASSSAPAPTLGGSAARADTKAANQQGAQYARQQATYAAGVDAPIRQREREGQSANRTAGNVRGLAHEAGTSAFLARLRANRRTPNPWTTLVSQLGSQIANHYEPTGG